MYLQFWYFIVVRYTECFIHKLNSPSKKGFPEKLFFHKEEQKKNKKDDINVFMWRDLPPFMITVTVPLLCVFVLSICFSFHTPPSLPEHTWVWSVHRWSGGGDRRAESAATEVHGDHKHTHTHTHTSRFGSHPPCVFTCWGFVILVYCAGLGWRWQIVQLIVSFVLGLVSI